MIILHIQTLLFLSILSRISADRQVIPMERPPDLLSSNPFLNTPSNVSPLPEWHPPTTTPMTFLYPLPLSGQNLVPLQYSEFKPGFSFPQAFPPSGAPTTTFAAAPAAPVMFPPQPFILPTVTIAPPPVPVTFSPMNNNLANNRMSRININPEAIMSVPDIIQHWGYPIEEHKVETADGYILTLHRIPYGRKNTNRTIGRPVVFLQHGLLCTSSIWLLNLPSQSAGFVFADQGFDVWLGNMRGNVYSKEHVSMSSDSDDFWKFSWEEMAEFDLPAMIDFVLKKTEQSSLYYVGHSQGALTMLAKLSKDQAFATKIRKFFALAPVSRMYRVKGLFFYLGQIYEQFKFVYRIFGDNEFLANNFFTSLLTDIICDKSANKLCENFIFSVSGPNSNQLNSSRIGIYLAHNPAGTSTRNMLHFAQMVHTKRLASFDRGKEANIRWYGTIYPPEYNLKNVNCDIHVIYSDYDWLASAADVEQFLISELPKTSLKSVRKLREFNHNDFLWGLRARKEIYDQITDVINIDSRRVFVHRGLNSYLKHHHNENKTIDEALYKTNNSLELD